MPCHVARGPELPVTDRNIEQDDLTNLVTRDKTTASKQLNSAHDDHDGTRTGVLHVLSCSTRAIHGIVPKRW